MSEELSASFVFRKAAVDGKSGAKGDSAWNVVLSPDVLSFVADANGTITNVDTINGEESTTKLSTVAIYYGATIDSDHKATIEFLALVDNSLVGIDKASNQLRDDASCYLSEKQPRKSLNRFSRLFLGELVSSRYLIVY